MVTFTEENYLKAIYKLSESETGAVNTNSLAEKLNTKAASVTDMLKKLAKKKLISYRKYMGFSLSAEGKKIALEVIRKHRLWEMFLVEKLGFNWHEVHEIAEELEHIRSLELIARLDKFLQYPKADPHGDPIPDARGKLRVVKSKPLASSEPSKKLIMSGVVDHSPTFLQYLDKIGMGPGDEIIIKEITDFDASLKLTINNGKKIFMSNQVAKNILVV